MPQEESLGGTGMYEWGRHVGTEGILCERTQELRLLDFLPGD